MAVKSRIVKSFLRDVAVVVFLIVAMLIFFGVSNLFTGEWEIKGKHKVLEEQDIEVSESIYVFKGGKFELKDSILTIDSGPGTEKGVFIEGDSELLLRESKILTKDYSYIISAIENNGKSPDIDLTNSKVLNHSGIYLFDNTDFEAVNSEVGELQVHDHSEVNLKNSKVYLTMFPQDEDVFKNLKAGEEITTELNSNAGWEIDIEASEVVKYQFDLKNTSGVQIIDSDDILISLYFNGETGNDSVINLPIGGVDKFNFNQFGFDVKVQNSIIDMYNFVTQDNSNIQINSTKIKNLISQNDSQITLDQSEIVCDLCLVNDNSKFIWKNIKVVDDPLYSSVLTMNGNSVVKVEDSDIRGLTIYLNDNSKLVLQNSKYDEDKIEKNGGELVVE